MFLNLKLFSNCVCRNTHFRKCPFKPISAGFFTSLLRGKNESDDVVDIDIENMMYEDKPISGPPLAPIDIDGWAEDDEKLGTVDIESFEKDKTLCHPIPKDRSGIYEFKGIKVLIPKTMLRPETYRYRLDDEDKEKLPDDIRVCTFDK